jgi:hypothetical protein
LEDGGGTLEFDKLNQSQPALMKALRNSDVAGIGRLVDVREGFSVGLGADSVEPAEFQYALLVLDPDGLVKGEADQFGPSGLVFVAVPYVGGTDRIAAAASAAGSASEDVVFFLESSRIPGVGKNHADAAQPILNEYAGRGETDPIFEPVHPALIFGVDLDRAQAFQLLAEDPVEPNAENRRVLRVLGVDTNALED